MAISPISDRRKFCPTSTLNLLDRGSGPWYPVDRLLSWYDRMSRVPIYLTGNYRTKLESDRVETAWYSTTVLLSGRDRPQGLCFLRGRIPSPIR